MPSLTSMGGGASGSSGVTGHGISSSRVAPGRRKMEHATTSKPTTMYMTDPAPGTGGGGGGGDFLPHACSARPASLAAGDATTTSDSSAATAAGSSVPRASRRRRREPPSTTAAASSSSIFFRARVYCPLVLCTCRDGGRLVKPAPSLPCLLPTLLWR